MSKTLFRSLAAAIALLVAAASFTQPAEAGRRGSGVAAGIIGGLAAGAIIGGVLSRDRVIVEEHYYAPPPRRYYGPPRRVHYDDGYAPRPWSGDWYAYCASKYRSFNSRTGTYITYDGEELFCE